MTKEIKGAFPVMITPMNQQEEIDWGGLKNNVQYFVDQGVAGLVVTGSTGEFVSLSKEERFQVCETVIQEVNGRVPVIVGTAAETTKDTIEYTSQAQSAGANMALIINSYYAKPKEEEIYHHFKLISETVDLPIMLYNNPHTSGVDLSTELILRIGRDFDNITHVKESSGDIRKVRDVSQLGNGFLKTFAGADDLVLESLLVGATGWISVAGNAVPRLATDLFNFVQNGEIAQAWQIYNKLLPLCTFLEESGKYVQISKRAMELTGQAGGPSRLPRLGITTEEDTKLKAILSELSVLV